MNLPVEDLTPSQIVERLSQYIVGQESAKKAVAVALRNRYRRLQLPLEQRDDVLPKNILMIGPTGVGKTEIARRLAQLARAPFIKVEATKFTEVGYVGRDVESMVRDLAAAAVRLVERERMLATRPEAEASAYRRAAEQVAEALVPVKELSYDDDGDVDWDARALEMAKISRERDQQIERFEAEIRDGKHQDVLIEVEVENQGTNFLQVFTPQGMEEMGLDMFGGNHPLSQRTTSYRRMKVSEALPILMEESAKQLMDSGTLHAEALRRAEQTGIIFIDEIDKVAAKSGGGSGPDVSREGVQRDLLPIIEGSTVATKFGPLKTDHVLFIAAGAFHMARPSDLIPELQGRLPIRVELENLGEEDLVRILREPKNALPKQYQQMLAVEDVHLAFTDDALSAIAHFAKEANQRIENIGARRLHTVMERLLEDILFDAPYDGTRTIVIDRPKVFERLEPLMKNLETTKRVL